MSETEEHKNAHVPSDRSRAQAEPLWCESLSVSTGRAQWEDSQKHGSHGRRNFELSCCGLFPDIEQDHTTHNKDFLWDV